MSHPDSKFVLNELDNGTEMGDGEVEWGTSGQIGELGKGEAGTPKASSLSIPANVPKHIHTVVFQLQINTLRTTDNVILIS